MKKTIEQIHTDRLQRLVDVIIPNIPKRRLDMLVVFNEHPCGAVGCVIGWASQDRTFKRQGMPFNYDFQNIRADTRDFFGLNYDEFWGTFGGTKYRTRRDVIRAIKRLIVRREELGDTP